MFKFEIQNKDEIKVVLDKYVQNFSENKINRLLDILGIRIINEAVLERFEKKTDVDGKAFQPVSEKYAKKKSKKGRDPDNILVYDGRLRNSIRHTVNNGILKVIAGDQDVPYAAVHNFGSSKMPKRQYLGIGKLEKELTENTIITYLKGL